MPFLPNIPQATDKISVSQGKILNNFTILGAIAGNANFSSASLNANSGFNFIHFATQGTSPPASASFQANVVGLYTFQNANTGQTELYVNKTNQATVVQVPATASILGALSSPGSPSNGWSYLPSGILMKWGFTTGGLLTGNSNTVVTFPVNAFTPVFTQIFTIVVTGYQTTSGNQLVTLVSFNNTSFTVFNRQLIGLATNCDCTFVAIGR